MAQNQDLIKTQTKSIKTQANLQNEHSTDPPNCPHFLYKIEILYGLCIGL